MHRVCSVHSAHRPAFVNSQAKDIESVGEAQQVWTHRFSLCWLHSCPFQISLLHTCTLRQTKSRERVVTSEQGHPVKSLKSYIDLEATNWTHFTRESAIRDPHLLAWSQCTPSKAAGSNPLRPLVWSVMRGGGRMHIRDLSLHKQRGGSIKFVVLSHVRSAYQPISTKHKVSSASWPEMIKIDLNTLSSWHFLLVVMQKAIIS